MATRVQTARNARTRRISPLPVIGGLIVLACLVGIALFAMQLASRQPEVTTADLAPVDVPTKAPVAAVLDATRLAAADLVAHAAGEPAPATRATTVPEYTAPSDGTYELRVGLRGPHGAGDAVQLTISYAEGATAGSSNSATMSVPAERFAGSTTVDLHAGDTVSVAPATGSTPGTSATLSVDRSIIAA
jgi:hypothetical protein